MIQPANRETASTVIIRPATHNTSKCGYVRDTSAPLRKHRRLAVWFLYRHRTAEHFAARLSRPLFAVPALALGLVLVLAPLLSLDPDLGDGTYEAATDQANRIRNAILACEGGDWVLAVPQAEQRLDDLEDRILAARRDGDVPELRKSLDELIELERELSSRDACIDLQSAPLP